MGNKVKQLSKKDFAKSKPQPDEGHWEGKYWCNCRIRNKRKWLGMKKYGKVDEANDRCTLTPQL